MKQPYEMETTEECHALMQQLERALNAKAVELLGREVSVVILLADPIPSSEEYKTMCFTNMRREESLSLIRVSSHMAEAYAERN